jgi:2Fe-2S ferredoxin
MPKNSIQFTFIESGVVTTIETTVGAYRDLMVLLNDKLYLDNFGECGGMGRCATCVVKTDGIKGKTNNKERNEPTTLHKMGYTENNIRLACQLMITEDLDGAIIELMST